MIMVRLFILRFFPNAEVVEFSANNFTVGYVRIGTG